MALTAGIQSETAAYVFYIEASKKTQAKQFKDVLEKLAFEEKMHFQILEGQHHSLIKSEKWISTADILKREGLPEIGEDMTDVHRDLIKEVHAADSVKKILDIAYRLEVEAFELFEREAGRTTSDEGKKIFQDLGEIRGRAHADHPGDDKEVRGLAIVLRQSSHAAIPVKYGVAAFFWSLTDSTTAGSIKPDRRVNPFSLALPLKLPYVSLPKAG